MSDFRFTTNFFIPILYFFYKAYRIVYYDIENIFPPNLFIIVTNFDPSNSKHLVRKIFNIILCLNILDNNELKLLINESYNDFPAIKLGGKNPIVNDTIHLFVKNIFLKHCEEFDYLRKIKNNEKYSNSKQEELNFCDCHHFSCRDEVPKEIEKTRKILINVINNSKDNYFAKTIFQDENKMQLYLVLTFAIISLVNDPQFYKNYCLVCLFQRQFLLKTLEYELAEKDCPSEQEIKICTLANDKWKVQAPIFDFIKSSTANIKEAKTLLECTFVKLKHSSIVFYDPLVTNRFSENYFLNLFSENLNEAVYKNEFCNNVSNYIEIKSNKIKKYYQISLTLKELSNVSFLINYLYNRQNLGICYINNYFLEVNDLTCVNGNLLQSKNKNLDIKNLKKHHLIIKGFSEWSLLYVNLYVERLYSICVHGFHINEEKILKCRNANRKNIINEKPFLELEKIDIKKKCFDDFYTDLSAIKKNTDILVIDVLFDSFSEKFDFEFLKYLGVSILQKFDLGKKIYEFVNKDLSQTEKNSEFLKIGYDLYAFLFNNLKASQNPNMITNSKSVFDTQKDIKFENFLNEDYQKNFYGMFDLMIKGENFMSDIELKLIYRNFFLRIVLFVFKILLEENKTELLITLFKRADNLESIKNFTKVNQFYHYLKKDRKEILFNQLKESKTKKQSFYLKFDFEFYIIKKNLSLYNNEELIKTLRSVLETIKYIDLNLRQSILDDVLEGIYNNYNLNFIYKCLFDERTQYFTKIYSLSSKKGTKAICIYQKENLKAVVENIIITDHQLEMAIKLQKIKKSNKKQGKLNEPGKNNNN